MAKFTIVSAPKVHELPENVDLRLEALVGPMPHTFVTAGPASGGARVGPGAAPRRDRLAVAWRESQICCVL